MDQMTGQLFPASVPMIERKSLLDEFNILRQRGFVAALLSVPELTVACAFAVLMLLIAQVYSLPVTLPGRDALQFTGMHYAVPLSVLFGVGLFIILSKRRMRIFYYLLAAFSYMIILVAHFNIKTWMNIINPARWDALYWNIDEFFRPVIDASFRVHEIVAIFMPMEDKLYLFAFLAMFGLSIVVHSLRQFIVFRQVIFTAMLVHILGALSYLIMPAVGPFIYEAGNNALEAQRQVHMYGAYQALMAGGRPWLAESGDQYLFAAVAAMPSLHVASSAVFVYYAWKNERWLAYCYMPLFLFIIAEAMATRWHYLVDIFVGLGLTAVAVAICSVLFRQVEEVKA